MPRVGAVSVHESEGTIVYSNFPSARSAIRNRLVVAVLIALPFILVACNQGSGGSSY